jgi:hypothetical protein
LLPVTLRNLDDFLLRARPFVRAATLALAAWSAFACLYVVFGRVSYPYDLEWMSGSILDHVERVQQGLPLYVPPTSGWIPFLYPPLYFWLAAALAKVLPAVFACRTISIVATFVQVACVWRLSGRHGATRFWRCVAVGLFFACYQQTDFWYDIERPDSLFVAMALVATVILDEYEGLAGAALAGATLAAAFFVKQPASLFIVGAATALAIRRDWARLAVFAGVCLACIVPTVRMLDRDTAGWFGYYVLRMPLAHGMSWSQLPLLLQADLPHSLLLLLATLAMLGVFAWNRAREDAHFVGALAAGFLASMSSRLHIGGWSNVLMFWTSFGVIAVGIVGSRLENLAGRLEPNHYARLTLALALPAFAGMQMNTYSFVPADLIPKRKSAGQYRTVVDEVRRLEQAGDVIALGRGHLTTQRHFHISALIDVITVEHKVPDDILRKIDGRGFAAIVIDSLDDLRIPLHPEIDGQLFWSVAANYYVAEALPELLPPIIGWPARPTWVLLPRPTPLDGHDRMLVGRSIAAEMGVAGMRALAETRGTTFPQAPEGTESIARDVVRRTFEKAVDPDDAGYMP